MDYEVHFVHAPSASGKTTFLQRGSPAKFTINRSNGPHDIDGMLYRHGNAGLVDGDDIIHHTIGWPLDKKWFTKAGATYVHAAQLFALVNTAMRIESPPWMDHLVIMFNGGMRKIAVAENLYAVNRESNELVKLHHHTMIPSREDHELYIEARRKENMDEGRSWTFPRDWGDAHNNRESVKALSALFGTTLHSNFDDILKEIGVSSEAKSTEKVYEDRETENVDIDGWTFEFAAHGYKDTDPPNGGSTRIVWKHPSGCYLVMKLFDDGGPPYPEEPRTIKFWKTSDFKSDYMKWASAQHQFVPDEEQMNSFVELLKEIVTATPLDELPELWEN